MPTSDPRIISTIVHRAIGLMPRSVLDLGIGYGKYGVLLREYLHQNTSHPVVIQGVEGFADYWGQPWCSYDHVRRENFALMELWPHYVGFDLVLMIDSLEHLDLVLAKKLLTHLIKNNKTVIVSVPNGPSPQGPYLGNELEEHRSTWYRDDLAWFGGHVLLDHTYGLVVEFTK